MAISEAPSLNFAANLQNTNSGNREVSSSDGGSSSHICRVIVMKMSLKSTNLI
jgi:hypothetical protein